jgi:TusA-related sulfurtransferase
MSYKLYTDKTETFKCKIHLEGAELTEAKSRLVIESPKFSLLFEGTIDKNGNCEVPIKKLKNVLKENDSGKMKLEVIADDTYFEPWTSDFSVDTSKKIKVEVKEYKQQNTKPKIKITEVNKPKELNPINEISNMFNKKGITLKKFVENKQKFVPILKEYSEKVNYKKGTKTFIVEVVKKLKN